VEHRAGEQRIGDCVHRRMTLLLTAVGAPALRETGFEGSAALVRGATLGQ
jgi:hypothetical protein